MATNGFIPGFATPMRFLVSLLLFSLLGSCDEPGWPKLIPGPKVRAGAKPEVKIIARGENWIWLTESYPSKPQGMSRCQAGVEIYLRLLEKTGTKFREKTQIKIGSCLDDIEIAENGLRWDGAAKRLTLQILGGAAASWHYNETKKKFELD